METSFITSCGGFYFGGMMYLKSRDRIYFNISISLENARLSFFSSFSNLCGFST